MSDPFEFGTAFLEKCSDEIREIYAYWDGKKADRSFPARADLDPLDIPHLLPGLILVDVVSTDPLDLVYRLVGTREVDYRNSDPTGKTVSEAFYGKTLQDTLETYQLVIDRKEPLYRGDSLKVSAFEEVREERIFLPLSKDGKTVSQVMVFITERPIKLYPLHLQGPKPKPET